LGFYKKGLSLAYVYLKITAKFKTADLAKDVLFTREYNIGRTGMVYDPNYSTVDIKPASGCNTFTPPATNAEIASVCNSAPYISKISQYLSVVLPPLHTTPETNENKWDFNVTPNPVGTGTAIMKIKMPESSSLQLYIVDMTGRTVKSVINTQNHASGDFTAECDLSSLAKGAYIGIMVTKNGTITRKIIHN
jgi:hypothetical protein